MFTFHDGITIKTARGTWVAYVGELEARGLTAEAAYVNNQAGMWTLDDFPAVPLDRAGWALFDATMHADRCEHCGRPTDEHDDGRCPEPLEAA